MRVARLEGSGKVAGSTAIHGFITTLCCKVSLDKATRLVFELQQWFSTGVEVGRISSPKGTFHNVWRHSLLSQLLFAAGIEWAPELLLNIL